MALNRPLLMLQPHVKLTLKSGEKIEGRPNYTDRFGLEIYDQATREFRWIARSEIR